MTLEEAQYNAQQYYNYSRSLPEGLEKQNAYATFMYWQQEVNKLTPYQVPSQYMHPQQGTPAYAPVRKKLPALLTSAIIFILISGGISVLSVAAKEIYKTSGEWANGQTPTHTPAIPTTIEPTLPSTVSPNPTVESDNIAPLPPAATASGTEDAWRAGTTTSSVPDGVDQAQPSEFMAGYPTPESWLQQVPTASTVNIVMTPDTGYNCGWKPENVSGGCYNPKYGKTLFLWWQADAEPEYKEFVLAHELSHYYQWEYEFDLMQSASSQGFNSSEAWILAVETDATCRVLSWGGYDEAIADRSSSPCSIDNWQEQWLNEQALALGIVVENY